MEPEADKKEVEHDIAFDDEGNVILKKKTKVRRGSKSRSGGRQFELRVRKDLEDKGWIVDKWSNNLDLSENKIIPAKRKFNPFSKIMTIGTGFPDFIAFQLIDDKRYKLIGVEVKMGGNLSRDEKKKCKWMQVVSGKQSFQRDSCRAKDKEKQQSPNWVSGCPRDS